MKKKMINYNNRNFVLVENSESGDASVGQTIFHFYQEENAVWSIFKGGSVAIGTMVVKVNDDSSLDINFQQVTIEGSIKAGTAKHHPEILADGRIRLVGTWQFTLNDTAAGEAIFEEIQK